MSTLAKNKKRTAAERKAAKEAVAAHHVPPAPVKSVDWVARHTEKDPLREWPGWMRTMCRRTSRSLVSTCCDLIDNSTAAIDVMNDPLEMVIDLVGYNRVGGEWQLDHETAEIWFSDNSCGIALDVLDQALLFCDEPKKHKPGTPTSQRIHEHNAGMKTAMIKLGRTASSIQWIATKTKEDVCGHVFSYIDRYDPKQPIGCINIYADDGKLTGGEPIFGADGPRGPDGNPVFGPTEQGTQIKIVDLSDVVPSMPKRIFEDLMPQLGRTYAVYLDEEARTKKHMSFMRLRVRLWGRTVAEDGTATLVQLWPEKENVGPVRQRYRRSDENSGGVPPTLSKAKFDFTRDAVYEKYTVRYKVPRGKKPALEAEFVIGLATAIDAYAPDVPKGHGTGKAATKSWGIQPYNHPVHVYFETGRLLYNRSYQEVTGKKTNANHNVAYACEIHLLNSEGISTTYEKSDLVENEVREQLYEGLTQVSQVFIAHWSKCWSSPDTVSRANTTPRVELERILVDDFVRNNLLLHDPLYPDYRPAARWAGGADKEMQTRVGKIDIVYWEDYNAKAVNEKKGVIYEAYAYSINAEKVYQALRYRDEVLNHPELYPEVDPNRLIMIGFATQNKAVATTSGFCAKKTVEELHGLKVEFTTWEALGYDDAKIQNIVADAGGLHFTTSSAYSAEDKDEVLTTAGSGSEAPE